MYIDDKLIGFLWIVEYKNTQMADKLIGFLFILEL